MCQVCVPSLPRAGSILITSYITRSVLGRKTARCRKRHSVIVNGFGRGKEVSSAVVKGKMRCATRIVGAENGKQNRAIEVDRVCLLFVTSCSRSSAFSNSLPVIASYHQRPLSPLSQCSEVTPCFFLKPPPLHSPGYLLYDLKIDEEMSSENG
jgi:hypothetical protein